MLADELSSFVDVVCAQIEATRLRLHELIAESLIRSYQRFMPLRNMSKADEAAKKKWLALMAFLIIDLAQILFISLLTLDESSLWIVGFDLSQTSPIVSLSLFIGIGVAQFVLIYLVSITMLKAEDLVMLHPTIQDNRDWSCHHSRDQIVQWTLDLARDYRITVDRIYLMRSPMPNAFTFSLPILGSVVVIHSNLLDLLNEIEVRAVISHEIGHIRNHDSLISVFSRMPTFFVDIIYLYIYIRLGLGAANSLFVAFDPTAAGIRFLVLMAFFVISRFLMTISQALMKRASRRAELLADFHAADSIGVEVTMNALIRLGQRIETIIALIEEIRWLESLNPERMNPVTQEELLRMISNYPLDAIEEDNARLLAPWVFLSTRLKTMREVYGLELDNEQIETVVKPAAAGLLSRRAGDASLARKLKKEIETIDWRDLDYDGDRRLSNEELTNLISVLRSNPGKFMFDSEVGQSLLLLDHPDFRNRILFLADIFDM
jgi:Zn-dependent protease with chaperone function